MRHANKIRLFLVLKCQETLETQIDTVSDASFRGNQNVDRSLIASPLPRLKLKIKSKQIKQTHYTYSTIISVRYSKQLSAVQQHRIVQYYCSVQYNTAVQQSTELQ